MQAVQRVPIVQQVVDSLKQFIMSGELAVGDKLPSEASLCEKLSVGRGTIREATRILQAKGFIEIKAGRGAFVARIEELDKNEIIAWFVANEIEIMDLLEVRAAIEPLAVKLAIERSTPKDVEKLKKILEDTSEAVERHDISAIGELDEKFHSFIVKCSRNKLLISINKQIVDYLKTFREMTFYIPSNVKNLITPHSNIVSAFVQKDQLAGSEYMIEHLKWVRTDLEKSKDPDAIGHFKD